MHNTLHIIVGQGEHASVVADLLSQQGIKFFCVSEECLTEDFLFDFKNANFCLSMGDSLVRFRIYKYLLSKRMRIPALIHPTATVSPGAIIGNGSVILSRSFVGVNTVVGHASIINTMSSIDHNCIVGHAANISPGVILGGGVKIGNFSVAGLGAIVRDHVSIADHVIIGMGSVVTESITVSGTYIGNPARLRLI